MAQLTMFLSGLFLGFTLCEPPEALKQSNWQQEAIKRNVAEWIVDPTTGKTTFTWKPIP